MLVRPNNKKGTDSIMNTRERLKTIIAGEASDRCGFWLGNPHADTWPILHKYFGTETEEALGQKLKGTLRLDSIQFVGLLYLQRTLNLFSTPLEMLFRKVLLLNSFWYMFMISPKASILSEGDSL